MTAGRRARSPSVRWADSSSSLRRSGSTAEDRPASWRVAFLVSVPLANRAPIRGLGRVVAPGDACTAADLLSEAADRMEEVHIGASEVVHPLKSSQGWGLPAA